MVRLIRQAVFCFVWLLSPVLGVAMSMPGTGLSPVLLQEHGRLEQMTRGLMALEMGDLERARNTFDELTTVLPTAETWLFLGNITERLGDRVASEHAYEAAQQARGTLTAKRLAAEAEFEMFVENGQREAAITLAQRWGWLPDDGECRATGKPLPKNRHAETRTREIRLLVRMLVIPETADCLLDLGMALTDDGLVRLARVVLLDRIAQSSDISVRVRAEHFLRYRLPPHMIPKKAESLNIIGSRLQSRGLLHRSLKIYQSAIDADPAFSWPYHNIARV